MEIMDAIGCLIICGKNDGSNLKFDYKQGPPKICSRGEAIFTYAIERYCPIEDREG